MRWRRVSQEVVEQVVREPDTVEETDDAIVFGKAVPLEDALKWVRVAVALDDHQFVKTVIVRRSSGGGA